MTLLSMNVPRNAALQQLQKTTRTTEQTKIVWTGIWKRESNKNMERGVRRTENNYELKE